MHLYESISVISTLFLEIDIDLGKLEICMKLEKYLSSVENQNDVYFMETQKTKMVVKIKFAVNINNEG